MKQVRLTYLWLLIPICVYGQQSSQPKYLSGRLLDSASLMPLPFVTVMLKAFGDSTAKYTLTDSTGTYLFKELSNDTYTLNFSIQGYQNGQIKNIVLIENLALKPYLMPAAAIQLSAVIVSAGRMPISPKIDGFTYDARRDIPVAGETASDLLRKLPAVIVSPDGTPTIRGSSAIKVFIDNRPSEILAPSITEALKQVTSERISRIDVITQPSARYDAEGVDAVILIFTKRPVNNGLSGSINGQASNRNASLVKNLNISHNKWVTAVDAGYYFNNNPSGSELTRTSSITASDILKQWRENNSLSNSMFTSANFMYNIDTISSWNAGYRFGRSWSEDRNTLLNTQSSSSAINEFTRNIDNRPTSRIHTLNAGYSLKSKDKKTEINVLGLYFYQKQSGSYTLEQERQSKVDYRENNRSAVDNYEASVLVDLTKETSNSSVLETGAKVTYRDFSNSSNFGIFDFNRADYLPDTIRSNSFWFGRTIVAGYINYLLKLEKWKVRTGLRYEQTLLNVRFGEAGPFNVPDYKNLLPSVLLSRALADDQQFSIGYSKKLLRPYIAYMNPVVNYIDSLNLEYGNPRLRPVITHAVEGNYTLTTKKILLSLSFYYNQNNNSIENVRTLKPGRVVESTYMNIASNRILGSTLNVSYRSNKWSVNTNHNVRYIKYGNKSVPTLFSGTISSHYLNIGYKFNSGFSAELSGTLNAGQINYQSKITGSQWYSLLAVKNFDKGRFGISLRLDNLANPTQYVTEEIITEPFTQHTQRNFPLLLTRLGFFYKIGKKEVQVPVTRRINVEN